MPKTIEQIRRDYVCKQGCEKSYLAFQENNVHCTKCGGDYDLQMKTYPKTSSG